MCLAISAIPIGIIGGIQGFGTSFYLIGLIFLVTFVASLVMAYFISRPIERLTKNIKRISRGELDVQLGLSEIFEINNLIESLNRVLASLKLAVNKVGVKKGEIFEDAVKAKEAFEKKQRDLYNSVNGWVWETDSKGIYTFVSDNVENYLGYNQEELKNRSVFDFMTAEDVKQAKKVFNESSKKQNPIKNLENWNIQKNGDKISVLTNGYPYFDDNGNLKGYRGVSIDITKLKDAEFRIQDLKKDISDLKIKISDLLNEREKNLNFKDNIVDTKTQLDKKWSEHEFDSVFIFDENANIIDCNDKMVERLGYSKGEFLSLNIADFDALETKEDILNKIKQVKKEEAMSFKTIHKRKDGSAILVYENIQFLKDQKKFKCIVREDYSLKKHT